MFGPSQIRLCKPPENSLSVVSVLEGSEKWATDKPAIRHTSFSAVLFFPRLIPLLRFLGGLTSCYVSKIRFIVTGRALRLPEIHLPVILARLLHRLRRFWIRRIGVFVHGILPERLGINSALAVGFDQRRDDPKRKNPRDARQSDPQESATTERWRQGLAQT